MKTCELLIAVLLFLSIISACESKGGEAIDVNQLQSLYISMEYEAIVRKYEAVNWEIVIDPSVIMWYCDALVETRRDAPMSLRHPSVSIGMERFVSGYMLLRNGKLQQALPIFLELANSPYTKLWGAIGLVEYAFITENVVSLEDGLLYMRQVNESSKTTGVKRAISEYSAWLSYLKGDYAQARETIQSVPSSLSSLSRFELDISIMLRENRLAEALRAADRIIELNPEYQDGHALKAQIILRTRSKEEALKYLEDISAKHPRMWKVRSLYAESLINAGQVARGIAQLKGIAEERPFDMFSSLLLAEMDLMHGDGAIAKEVVNTYKLSLVGLPIYDVILARTYWYGSDKKQARRFLDLALSMNPMLPEALWLKYEMEVKVQDFNSVRKTLAVLNKLDPYDVSTLIALADLSCKGYAQQDFQFYRTQLLNSGRFVSEAIKKELVCR